MVSPLAIGSFESKITLSVNAKISDLIQQNMNTAARPVLSPSLPGSLPSRTRHWPANKTKGQGEAVTVTFISR